MCVAATFARERLAAASRAWALFNQQTLLVLRAPPSPALERDQFS
jgi:hypothetical protein